MVLLRRYSRNYNDVDLRNEIDHMKSCEKKMTRNEDIEEIMGYEWTEPKYYFHGLLELVDEKIK